MSKSVTFVTSSKLFWDNPYTRARALRLMQEDVTDVTNVTHSGESTNLSCNSPLPIRHA